jgi:hypothetical protein
MDTEMTAAVTQTSQSPQAPRVLYTVTDADIETCAELLSMSRDESQNVSNHSELPPLVTDEGEHIESESSSTSSRPSHYAQNYSEADIDKCVKIMQDTAVGARSACSSYFREHHIEVPHTTVNSRYMKMMSGKPDPLRGSAYLFPSQRQQLADWIILHSRAHLCLTKELLNAKVMQLASFNGQDMKIPPGKHFWSAFFKEVIFFLFFPFSFLLMFSLVLFFCFYCVIVSLFSCFRSSCFPFCCIQFPQIVMKKGYYTSASRAFAFNETNVREWFKQYEQLLKDLGIKNPLQLFNADEV